jgi:hypothetical protein
MCLDRPRHRLLVWVLAILLVAFPPPAGLWAASTPVASAAIDEFPVLTVRVTDDAIEAPAEVPAGRYLYITENATEHNPMQDTLAAGLFPLQGDMTLASLNAIRTDENATFYYDVRWAGESIPLRGHTASTIVDLTPGDWTIVLPEPFAPQPAVALTVTAGTDPSTQPEPQSDGTVTLRDHAFAGIPDRVASGRHVWKLTNAGQQPHIMFLLRYPEVMPLDQAQRLYSLPPGATPPPDLDVDPTRVAPAGGMGPLPAGGTAWGIYDLEPGSYLAICFVTDPETGTPHFLLGMTHIFIVEGAAATPAS